MARNTSVLAIKNVSGVHCIATGCKIKKNYFYETWLFVRLRTPTFHIYSYGMTSHHMTNTIYITWRLYTHLVAFLTECLLSSVVERSGWIIPFCLRVMSSTPNGRSFVWLLGRLGLGARSWVRIGLGVRLGSVFSLSRTAKLLPYE